MTIATNQKPRRALALVACLAAHGLLAGCQLDGSIDKATTSLHDASTNIRQGLEGGAEKIDPAGIKKLLAENETLRQNLLDLQVRTSSFTPNDGLIKLSNLRLILRVAEYTGDFVLNSWIDDKIKWIHHDRLLNAANAARIAAGTSLGVNMETAFRGYCMGTHTGCNPLTSAENVWGAQNYFYQNSVVPQFNALVAAAVDAENKRSIDLQQQIPPGRHWLTVEITPVAKAAGSNDWFIRWQLVQIFADHSEHVLKEADASSSLPGLANHPLGTPLKALAVPVDATQ